MIHLLTRTRQAGSNVALHDLFFQLCSGFAVAESVLAKDGNIPKLFYDCKDYITTTCQSGLPIDILDDLCKVFIGQKDRNGKLLKS